MKHETFVGMVGGKPRSAYFFCGHIPASGQLLFLDPHLSRPDPQELICSEPSLASLQELDPCLSFGFLLKSLDELQMF